MTLIAAFGAPLRWLAPALEDVSRFILDAPPARAAPPAGG